MTARKLANDLDFNGRLPIGLGGPVADNDATRKIYVDTGVASAKSRANHVGTQLAATISDFDIAVRLNALDQLAAPTNPLSLANHRIINVSDPTSAQDAATMGWTQGQVAGLVSGQTLKGTVKAVSSVDVNLAAAPGTIDGVTAVNGDVFLLAGQATATQNGPYQVTGSTLVRAANWDSAGEAVVGSYWIVRQGTQGDKFALMTNDTFALGTDAATFTYVGTAVGASAPFEANLGDGGSTSFALVHNFGTRAVLVVLYRNASPWDEVDVYVRRPDINTVVIEPDVVFAANEFHAVVSKA